MPNIVDKINVGGQEYHLEPPMDAVPTQGSHNAVQSGGVYDALAGISISPTPAAAGVKAFSTGGAYDYFKTADSEEWRIQVFAHKLGQKFVRSASSEAAGYGFSDTCVTENGVFFAIFSQTLMKSFDGMNWEATGLTGLTQTCIDSAIYFKGKYIVSLGSSGTYVSEDLNTFTLTLDAYFQEYCNTENILIAATNSTPTATFAIVTKYTTDGINWHNCTWTNGILDNRGRIAYFNGVFVVQLESSHNTVFTSSDGMTYTVITYHSGSYLNPNGLVSTPVGFFVAGANETDSRIYKSVDGVNWTNTGYTRLYKSGHSSNPYAILSAGNLLYAATSESMGVGSDVMFVDSLGSVYGPTRLNGALWDVTNAGSSAIKARYIDGVYLITGSTNKISVDGVNFTRPYPVVGAPGKAALYHGTLVRGGYYSSVFDPRCL